MSVTREQLFQELNLWYAGLEKPWGNVFDELENELHYGVTLPSGELKHVTQEGGEGEGTEYFYVFSLGDQLFRVDGYYASWDGTTYHNYANTISEVEAVPTVVIQYNKKK